MRTAAHTPPPSSLQAPSTRTLLEEPSVGSDIHAKEPSSITATVPVSSRLESKAEPETKTVSPSSHKPTSDIKPVSKKTEVVEAPRKLEQEPEIVSFKSESVSAKPCIEAIDLTDEPDSPAKEAPVPEVKATLKLAPKFELKHISPKDMSPKQVSLKHVSPQQVSPKQASPKQISPKETSLPQLSPKQLSPKHASPQQLSHVTLSPATEPTFEPVTREPPTTPTKPKHIPSLPNSPALHVRFNNRSQHSPVKASLANVTSPSSPRGSFLATRQMSSFQSKPKFADGAAAGSAQPLPPPIVNNTNGAHMSGNPPAAAGTFLASRTNTPIPIRTMSPVRGGFVQSAMLKRHDSVSFQRARAGSTTDSPDLTSPFSTASRGSNSNNGSPVRGFSRSASVSPRKGHARTQSLNSMSYSISSPSFAGYMSKDNDLNEVVPMPTPTHNLVQRMGKLNLDNSPRLEVSPKPVEEISEEIVAPEAEVEPEVEVKPVSKVHSPKVDESPEMMERLRRLKEMKELTAKHQMRERAEQERRLQLRHERELKRMEELQKAEEAESEVVELEKPVKPTELVEVVEFAEPMEIVEETAVEKDTQEDIPEVAEPVDIVTPEIQKSSPVEVDTESSQDDSASVSTTDDMSPKSSSSSSSSDHELPVERPTTPIPAPARSATMSSQTSPVRRWNPVRSTWLESALKKTPSSPGGDRGNMDRSLGGGANSPAASGLTPSHSVSFPRGKVPLPAPLGSFVKNSPPKSLSVRNPTMANSLREESRVREVMEKKVEVVEEPVAKEQVAQPKLEPAHPEITKSSSIHEPIESTVLPKANRSHLFAPGRAPKPRVPSPSTAMLLNRASTLRPTPKKTAQTAATPEALERLRQLRTGTQNRFVPSTQDQSDLVQFKANLKRSSTIQHTAPDMVKETILGARSSLRSAATAAPATKSMEEQPIVEMMEEPVRERPAVTPLGLKREVNEQTASLKQTEQAALPSPPTLAVNEKVIDSPTTPTSLEQRAWVPSPPLSPAAKHHDTVTPLQDESENEVEDYASEADYEDDEEEEEEEEQAIIYAPPPRSMPKPIRGGIVSKAQADPSQAQQDENTPPPVVA